MPERKFGVAILRSQVLTAEKASRWSTKRDRVPKGLVPRTSDLFRAERLLARSVDDSDHGLFNFPGDRLKFRPAEKGIGAGVILWICSDKDARLPELAA